MRRLIGLAVILASLAACNRRVGHGSGGRVSAACPRVPEAGAVRTDSIPLECLTGRSRLVLVDTVNAQLEPTIVRVELQAPDSTFLAILANAQRPSPLAREPSRPRTAPPLVQFHAGSEIWLAHQFGMSVGECLGIGCTDTSPTYLKFRY